MAAAVSINRLEPANGKRDALIGPLPEFAGSINAAPVCLHCSVHEPIDDEATPLMVDQAHTTVASFEKHGEWTSPNVPRQVPLPASPPYPPVLLRSVSLGGAASTRWCGGPVAGINPAGHRPDFAADHSSSQETDTASMNAWS